MNKWSALRAAHPSVLEHLEGRRLLTILHPIARPIHFKSDGVSPQDTAAPTGTTPSLMRSAYGVGNIVFGSVSGTGAGQTIAIIDAYNDPNIVTSSSASYGTSDLYKFNNYFGLQQFGTSGGPTFTKIGETSGGSFSTSSYPTSSKDWSGEIAMDVEWAHVIAPQANIVLIEAYSANDSDLFTASANYAKAYAGVTSVSMSFGGVESSGDTAFNSIFSTQASGHANVAWFSSSGDDGGVYKSSTQAGGPEYPSDSPYVVAVGGTTLTLSGSNYSSEAGWSGSGGGISAVESKPTYQSSVTLSSTFRTVPDISMDADPNSGVPVYDSYGEGTSAPWVQYGGTSLSSPMWAGLNAIVNQGLTINGQSSMTSFQLLTKLYAAPSTYFHDITTGSNGLATRVGYDLVTGIGSPIANTLISYLAGSSTTATSISAPVLASASDSGVSGDGITNVTKPTFTGTTNGTGTVNILVDGNIYGSGTASGGTYSVTLTTALTDGQHTITAAIGSLVSSGTTLVEDTATPVISSSVFNYSTAAHSVSVKFSENVSSTVDRTRFVIKNTTNGNIIVNTNLNLNYTQSTNTAVITFPGFTNGTLPNGNYSLTTATGITDAAGNALTAYTTTFFFLLGDANHDGTVNIADLGILASSYGVGTTFATGDFNYDGKVDIGDLGILATYYGTSVPTNAITAQALGRSLAFSDQAVAPSTTGTPVHHDRIADLLF